MNTTEAKSDTIKKITNAKRKILSNSDENKNKDKDNMIKR